MKLNNSIVDHDWNFDGPAAIDFDAVYEEAYKASNIPSLFDRVANLLRQIIDSGEVDSVKATKSLEELIDLLKQNCDGSYFSTYSTWQVVVATWRNVGRQYVISSKTIGPLVKGIEDTLTETGLSWQKLNDEMRAKIQSLLQADISLLAYSPTVGLPPPINGDESRATLEA
jgi:hypothetical protein